MFNLNPKSVCLKFAKSALVASAFLSSIGVSASEKSAFEGQESALSDTSWLTFNELNIKLGGWSHHTANELSTMYDYNESHNGYGLEANFNIVESDSHFLTAGFFHMDDSHDKPQKTYGIGYTYRFEHHAIPYIQGIDFNILMSYYERSRRTINASTFETKGFYVVEFFAPTPYLTVRVTENFNFDFFYLPSGIDDRSPATYFVRAGVALDSDLLSSFF